MPVSPVDLAAAIFAASQGALSPSTCFNRALEFELYATKAEQAERAAVVAKAIAEKVAVAARVHAPALEGKRGKRVRP